MVGRLDRRVSTMDVNGDTCGLGGIDMQIHVWDLEQGKQIFVPKKAKVDKYDLHTVYSSSCVRSGHTNVQFYVGSGKGEVYIYDIREGKRPVRDFSANDHRIMSMALHPNEHHLFVGDTVGNLLCLDLRAKSPGDNGRKYRGLCGSIRDIQLNSKGTHVACVGLDRMLHVHDVETKECITSRAFLGQRLNRCAFLDHDIEKSMVDAFFDDDDDEEAEDELEGGGENGQVMDLDESDRTMKPDVDGEGPEEEDTDDSEDGEDDDSDDGHWDTET